MVCCNTLKQTTVALSNLNQANSEMPRELDTWSSQQKGGNQLNPLGQKTTTTPYELA